jgi:hypothetical protein
MEETAGGVARWPVRRYGIWRLSCLSAGTTFAIWHDLCEWVKTPFAARVISRVTRCKRGTYCNLCAMCLVAAFVPHGRTNISTRQRPTELFRARLPLAIMTASPIALVRVFETVRDADVVSLHSQRRRRSNARSPCLSIIGSGDMLLARLRQVRRSHRSIHCWCAHAARRSALPRERFSPLTQSGSRVVLR